MIKTGNFVAYYRVSTKKQGASGLGLEAQQTAVRTYLNGGDWQLVGEFTEIESGKKSDRPQLEKAMNLCKLTGGTLVVAKLDRLSRDVAFLANLMNGEVPFVACDNPHATPFTIHILAAVAQHEREAISKRTTEALAAAKARGVKLGGFHGFKVDNALGRAAQTERAEIFASRILPIIRPMRERGDTLRAIAAGLMELKIKTARGGTVWSPAAVQTVLNRTT